MNKRKSRNNNERKRNSSVRRRSSKKRRRRQSNSCSNVRKSEKLSNQGIGRRELKKMTELLNKRLARK